MANTLTERIFELATVGIISTKPVWIRKIQLYPAAAGDAALLNAWDEGSPVAAGTKTNKAATITGTNTFTSTGNLPSGIADGYIFRITGTLDGTAANVGRYLVATAGDTNAVVLATAALANDTGKYFDWTTYPSFPAFTLLSQATNKMPYEMDFGYHGFWVPNLILETISSNAKIYLYLK